MSKDRKPLNPYISKSHLAPSSVFPRTRQSCALGKMCLTQILEVDPDLMHPSCERPAQDDAGLAVVAQPLELCPAFLAMGRDLAHPNLVTNHLHWLGALSLAPEKRRF